MFLAFGEAGDPAEVLALETLKEWMQTAWQFGEKLGNEVAAAWTTLWAAINTTKPLAWGAVTGPIGALIKTLVRYGWKPATPNRWISPKGELWEVAQQSNRALQDELRASVRAWIRKHAAAQQYGKGLELGIEAKANGTLLKSLASYGEVTYHGMLACIMAMGL